MRRVITFLLIGAALTSLIALSQCGSRTLKRLPEALFGNEQGIEGVKSVAAVEMWPYLPSPSQGDSLTSRIPTSIAYKAGNPVVAYTSAISDEKRVRYKEFDGSSWGELGQGPNGNYEEDGLELEIDLSLRLDSSDNPFIAHDSPWWYPGSPALDQWDPIASDWTDTDYVYNEQTRLTGSPSLGIVDTELYPTHPVVAYIRWEQAFPHLYVAVGDPGESEYVWSGSDVPAVSGPCSYPSLVLDEDEETGKIAIWVCFIQGGDLKIAHSKWDGSEEPWEDWTQVTIQDGGVVDATISAEYYQGFIYVAFRKYEGTSHSLWLAKIPPSNPNQKTVAKVCDLGELGGEADHGTSLSINRIIDPPNGEVGIACTVGQTVVERLQLVEVDTSSSPWPQSKESVIAHVDAFKPSLVYSDDGTPYVSYHNLQTNKVEVQYRWQVEEDWEIELVDDGQSYLYHDEQGEQQALYEPVCYPAILWEDVSSDSMGYEVPSIRYQSEAFKDSSSRYPQYASVRAHKSGAPPGEPQGWLYHMKVVYDEGSTATRDLGYFNSHAHCSSGSEFVIGSAWMDHDYVEAVPCDFPWRVVYWPDEKAGLIPPESKIWGHYDGLDPLTWHFKIADPGGVHFGDSWAKGFTSELAYRSPQKPGVLFLAWIDADPLFSEDDGELFLYYCYFAPNPNHEEGGMWKGDPARVEWGEWSYGCLEYVDGDPVIAYVGAGVPDSSIYFARGSLDILEHYVWEHYLVSANQGRSLDMAIQYDPQGNPTAYGLAWIETGEDNGQVKYAESADGMDWLLHTVDAESTEYTDFGHPAPWRVGLAYTSDGQPVVAYPYWRNDEQGGVCCAVGTREGGTITWDIQDLGGLFPDLPDDSEYSVDVAISKCDWVGLAIVDAISKKTWLAVKY